MVRFALYSLWALACAAHGAKEVVLEPVFEKSSNGIFTEGKEVHFGFSLKNQTKDQLDLEVVWKVATDQKEPVSQSDPVRVKVSAGEKRISRYSAKIPAPGLGASFIFSLREGNNRDSARGASLSFWFAK